MNDTCLSFELNELFTILFPLCDVLSCGGMQYVRRAMSNCEKLELIIVTKSRVLGTPSLLTHTFCSLKLKT